MKPIHHLLILSVILMGVSGLAFHSQEGKRHMMSALLFDGIARSLEERIQPGISSLAGLDGILGGDDSRFGEWAREASELVVTARALRAEAEVLRCLADGDIKGAKASIDVWRDDDIQRLVQTGTYPANLRPLMGDQRLFQEFIRIRNQYIDPETHHWKLEG